LPSLDSDNVAVSCRLENELAFVSKNRDEGPSAPSSSNEVKSEDSSDKEKGFCCKVEPSSVASAAHGSAIDINPADRRAFTGEPVKSLLTASEYDATSTSDGDHVSRGASSCSSEEEVAGDLKGDFFFEDETPMFVDVFPFGSSCNEIPAKTLDEELVVFFRLSSVVQPVEFSSSSTNCASSFAAPKAAIASSRTASTSEPNESTPPSISRTTLLLVSDMEDEDDDESTFVESNRSISASRPFADKVNDPDAHESASTDGESFFCELT
jgi:hypothetical protein